MKLLLHLIQILIGIYWAGAVARENKTVDKLIKVIEGGYSEFNDKLKSTSLDNGLSKLQSFYGWSSIGLFAVFFIFSRFFVPSSNAGLWFSSLALFTIFSWFSLKWYREHKKIMIDIAPKALLFIFSPILMGSIDSIANTPFTEILILPLSELSNFIGIELNNNNNPIVTGSIISIFLLAASLCYYLLTWATATPLVFISVSIVILPIWSAKTIYTFSPKTRFFGFTVVVMIVVTLWLTKL